MQFRVNPADAGVFDVRQAAAPLLQQRAAQQQNALAYGGGMPNSMAYQMGPGQAQYNALAEYGGPTNRAALASGGGQSTVGTADAFRIRQGLISRGMPEHVADAFVMNFKDESGLNPGINETSPLVPGSRGGFGLAQWTGPRRRQLEAYAEKMGVPVSDLDMQLDFLMHEMETSEASAGRRIMGAQDAGSAAAAIVNHFLRPAESHRSSREARYLSSGGMTYPKAPASPQPLEGRALQPASAGPRASQPAPQPAQEGMGPRQSPDLQTYMNQQLLAAAGL